MPKAIPLAIFYIFFNVLLGILVTAFGSDPMVADSVGSGGASSYQVGATTDEDLSTVEAGGWVRGLRVTLFDLPWWLQTLFWTFEVGVLALIIYALVRGI